MSPVKCFLRDVLVIKFWLFLYVTHMQVISEWEVYWEWWFASAGTFILFLNDKAHRNPIICYHWNLVILSLEAAFFFSCCRYKGQAAFCVIAWSVSNSSCNRHVLQTTEIFNYSKAKPKTHHFPSQCKACSQVQLK